MLLEYVTNVTLVQCENMPVWQKYGCSYLPTLEARILQFYRSRLAKCLISVARIIHSVTHK